MKGSIRLILLTGICFFLGGTLGYAAESDSAYFHDYQFTKELNDNLKIFIQPTWRAQDNMGTLYYFHLRNGFDYSVSKYLSLGLVYRFKESTRSTSAGKVWGVEHRIEHNIAYKTKINKLKITDRVRLEYRYFDYLHRDKWRFRNLLTFSHPVEIFDMPLTLWAGPEFFYDINKDEIELWWLKAGVDKKLTKDVKATLYFIMQLKRRSEGVDSWKNIPTVGTKLSVSF